MIVRTIFTIDLQHEFFNNSHCRCLYIKPDHSCEALLKKYNLHIRQTENNLASVFSTENEGDELPGNTAEDLDFTFLLYLNDKTFLDYTRLPEKSKDEIFCFSNDRSDNGEGSALTTSLVKKGLVQPAPGSMLFGIIKLTLAADMFFTGRATAGKYFTLDFKASGIFWKYYILVKGTRKNVEIDGLLAGIEFEHQDDLADNTWKSLAATFPNDHLMLYTSKSEVAFRDTGLKNIRLLNADNKSVLVSHLPTPSFSDRGIKIINTSMV